MRRFGKGSVWWGEAPDEPAREGSPHRILQADPFADVSQSGLPQLSLSTSRIATAARRTLAADQFNPIGGPLAEPAADGAVYKRGDDFSLWTLDLPKTRQRNVALEPALGWFACEGIRRLRHATLQLRKAFRIVVNPRP